MSALREVIEAAKVETGLGLGNLTALSPQNDPYRLDTPANHVLGEALGNEGRRDPGQYDTGDPARPFDDEIPF